MSEVEFKQLESGVTAKLVDGVLSAPIESVEQSLGSDQPASSEQAPLIQSNATDNSKLNRSKLTLSDLDQQLLNGGNGKAAQMAMQIVVRMAELQGANKLVDVRQAHIDAVVYNGPSSLLFAQKLASLGGKVRVPTTLNSLSVDKRRWKNMGVADEFGSAASQLGDAYLTMGAKPSYTCAPYLLESAPKFGEQIVWAESNAVTYANSVLGARTQKYPDFLDACIALTARAPAAGAHLDAGRTPSVEIHVVNVDKHKVDDAFWPLLGYHIGAISRNDIPIIYGLEFFAPTLDNHKAFSAAFATTSSVAMYHIAEVTPEAKNIASTLPSSLESIEVDIPDLISSWNELNSASDDTVDVICLGNPHFSATECIALSELCEGRFKDPSMTVIVTLGRDVQRTAAKAGAIEKLESFGVQFINDTCWCMIEEPIIPVDARVLMTNSGKYAHYGPGLVDRPLHFGSLAACVDAACIGKREHFLPEWLT